LLEEQARGISEEQSVAPEFDSEPGKKS
jgi:hypothetical protein